MKEVEKWMNFLRKEYYSKYDRMTILRKELNKIEEELKEIKFLESSIYSYLSINEEELLNEAINLDIIKPFKDGNFEKLNSIILDS